MSETKVLSMKDAIASGYIWAVGDKAMDNMLRDQGSLKADPPAAGPVTADSLIAILESIQGKISDFAERAHSEFGRNVLHHQIGDLHTAIKVVKDFSKNEMIFPPPSPQPPAGPVWVKPDILRKNKLPSEGKDVYIRYDNGECKDTGDAVIIEALFWKGFKDVEWMDESNTQQVFTREQVAEILKSYSRVGYPNGNSMIECSEKSICEWFTANYPETK